MIFSNGVAANMKIHDNCYPVVQIHENVLEFINLFHNLCEKRAKGNQREPKGRQKESQMCQKGAKREPRGDQNVSKNRSSETVAKREPKRSPRRNEMGALWESFSIKNR